jgi:hypothetical protein
MATVPLFEVPDAGGLPGIKQIVDRVDVGRGRNIDGENRPLFIGATQCLKRGPSLHERPCTQVSSPKSEAIGRVPAPEHDVSEQDLSFRLRPQHDVLVAYAEGIERRIPNPEAILAQRLGPEALRRVPVPRAWLKGENQLH